MDINGYRNQVPHGQTDRNTAAYMRQRSLFSYQRLFFGMIRDNVEK